MSFYWCIVVESFGGEGQQEGRHLQYVQALRDAFRDTSTLLAGENGQPLGFQPIAGEASSGHGTLPNRKIIKGRRKPAKLQLRNPLESATSPGQCEPAVPIPLFGTGTNGTQATPVDRTLLTSVPGVMCNAFSFPNASFSASMDSQAVPPSQTQASASAISATQSSASTANSLQPFLYQFSAAPTPPVSVMSAHSGVTSTSNLSWQYNSTAVPAMTAPSAAGPTIAYVTPLQYPMCLNAARPLSLSSFGSAAAHIGHTNVSYYNPMSFQPFPPPATMAVPSNSLNRLSQTQNICPDVAFDPTGFTSARANMPSTCALTASSTTTSSAGISATASFASAKLTTASMQQTHTATSASASSSAAGKNSSSSSSESASHSNDHDECVVCMDHSSDCALYSCGHLCLCFACAQRIRASPSPLCPICKQVIVDVLRIFRS